MTYAGLIELLERLRANAEEHGRHRDVLELQQAILFLSGELTTGALRFVLTA